MKMKMKISLGFVLLASIAFAPAHNAMAGFQFTAPVQQQSNQLTPVPGIAPQMPAVPAVKVQSSPVMMPTVKQQQPRPAIQPTQPILRPTQPTIAPAPVKAQPTMASQNDLAVGFGKDLPISTAMKQVVPDGYTYLIDDGITGGKTVSWNGGKPWPQVLNDMVQPLGLTASVDGKIVRITNPSMGATTIAQPQVQLSTQVEPVRLASAPQFNNSNVMFDTLQSDAGYAPQTSPRRAPLMQAPRPPKQVNNAPQNIIGSQPREETMVLSSTEPEAIAELEKSVIPEVTQGQWMAQSGGSLKTVLESWSNLEGVDLFWSADYDYNLIGDVNISGNFEEAVEELLKGFSDAKPKPTGRLHPNLPHGPAVLVIEATQMNN